MEIQIANSVKLLLGKWMALKNCKGEQDTAELGANTDANHTYTNKKNEIFSGRYFLFDAYDRICFFLGISYFYIN